MGRAGEGGGLHWEASVVVVVVMMVVGAYRDSELGPEGALGLLRLRVVVWSDV